MVEILIAGGGKSLLKKVDDRWQALVDPQMDGGDPEGLLLLPHFHASGC